MKTSKIIFISYFSVFGLILISILVLGLINNDKDPIALKSSDLIMEEIPLNNIKYIRINKDCNIFFESDSCQKIEFSHQKEESFTEPKYEIINDTLVINSSAINESNKNITIKGNNIAYIKGVDCKIILYHLNQNNLTIEAENSDINLYRKIELDSLNLMLENSTVWGRNYNISYMSLDVNQSTLKCRNDTPLKSISGNAINKSIITIQPAFHYDLNIDESCDVTRH